MAFPVQRARRLRRSEAIRGMVRETRLTTQGFVYPMFVCPGSGVRNEVSSMPGVCQQSPDKLVEECREVEGLGIPAVMLFGLPEHKDEQGSEAWSADRRGAARHRSDSPRETQAGGDHRRLLVRIHQPRPLRRDRKWRGGQRPDAQAAGRRGALARPRGRRHRRSFGHDGWPRGGDSSGARCAQFRGIADLVLCREVLLRILRAVPRSGGIDAAVRRSRRATRWTRQTRARRCAKSRSISRRARTWSW